MFDRQPIYPTYLHINLAWTIVRFGILDVHLHDANNLWLVQESWHHDNKSIHHPLPISNFHDTSLFFGAKFHIVVKFWKICVTNSMIFLILGFFFSKNQGIFFPRKPFTRVSSLKLARFLYMVQVVAKIIEGCLIFYLHIF
jgi:hypothetical protein